MFIFRVYIKWFSNDFYCPNFNKYLKNKMLAIFKKTSRLIGEQPSLAIGFGFIVKIAFILTLDPPLAHSLFLPFVEFFAQHPLSNPYDEFYRLGRLDAFPYSSVMLWCYGGTSVIANAISSNFFETVKHVLPAFSLLFFDYVTFRALAHLLPAHRIRLAYLWWLNPLVIFICYFHGQLDIIPTATLMVSLCLLFSGSELLAFAVIGLGLGMKSHLFAALPFMAAFIVFRHLSFIRGIMMIFAAVGVFLLLQLPYWSSGYLNLVIFEKMSLRLFALKFPFDNDGLAFLFAPAVVMFLFYRFVSFQTTNRDTLMLVLGMLFAALVSVVPPTAGWFLWSMPFLTYFFVKHRETSRVSFYSLIGFYLVHQVFRRDSIFPQVFSRVFSGSQLSATMFQYIETKGFDSLIVQNVLFTAMEGALIMNVLWVYRVGISSSNLARRLKQNFRIGICGDSGSGKSTLTESLRSLFGGKDVLVVAGDDLHKWERGHEMWKEKTHLDPKANRLHEDVAHAEQLMVGRNIRRSFYDHKSGSFTSPKLLESRPVIIFQGLHTFFLDRMRNMMHVKIFVDPDKKLRYAWKIKRDMSERGYTKENVLDQLTKREADAVNYIETQRVHADITIRFIPASEGLDLDGLLLQEEIPVKLQVILTGDINVEPLVTALAGFNGFQSDYWYNVANDRVVMECQGHISADQIKTLAENLVLAHQELVGAAPVWRYGYDGVTQLIMLLYLEYFYSERRTL